MVAITAATSTTPDTSAIAEQMELMAAFNAADKEGSAEAHLHFVNDVMVRNHFIHQHEAAVNDSLEGLFGGQEAISGEDAASFMPVTFGP